MRQAWSRLLMIAVLTGCAGGENEEVTSEAGPPPTDLAEGADASGIPDVALPEDAPAPTGDRVTEDVPMAVDAGTPVDLPEALDGSELLDASPGRDAVEVRDAAGVAVRITAPTEGAAVSGVVSITATASAPGGISRVVFFSQGGGYRIGEDTTAPFALDWYTQGFVPDGPQRLRVVAYASSGSQAMHEVNVQVRNTGTMPPVMPPTPPSTTLPADDLARVTAYFESRRSARYMERDCQPTSYPGWSGVPVQLCRYRVSDRYSGGTRWADVILANASPAQLARWVVQAALERRGRVQRSDTDRLCSEIMGQSGAQFPVAGVVYEDMYSDGQRIYPFRNGVTVRIEGLPFTTREQPSESQMALYRTNAVVFVGNYGRIIGTRPEHWTALTGERIPSDRSTWPDIVARAYRAAWGQDRNALIVAWARANL